MTPAHRLELAILAGFGAVSWTLVLLFGSRPFDPALWPSIGLLVVLVLGIQEARREGEP